MLILRISMNNMCNNWTTISSGVKTASKNYILFQWEKLFTNFFSMNNICQKSDLLSLKGLFFNIFFSSTILKHTLVKMNKLISFELRTFYGEWVQHKLKNFNFIILDYITRNYFNLISNFEFESEYIYS